MNDKITKSLFMESSIGTEFYKRLLESVHSIKELGSKLVRYAENSRILRQSDRVQEAARILSNLPINDFHLIGQYYLAWAGLRQSSDLNFAKKKFESIANKSSVDWVRGRAILSLAAIAAAKNDLSSELFYGIEASKVLPDISFRLEILKGIAVIKAKQGDHKAAIRELEKHLPLLRYSKPNVYFDYLNSYAVELGEVGRVEEAYNISRIVLASPFASAYPEWLETAQVLRQPDRSFVAVPSTKHEQLKSETSQTRPAQKPQPQAKVLPFSPLKKAPEPMKPERLTPQEINELSLIEKRDLILAAIRTSQMSEFEYDKLIVAVGLLKSGPTDKVLDLEDEQTLDDISVVWANNIGPEEFAAVLSALRDCEDSLRQKDIMDRMIRKAFEQSQQCGLTEEAWRLEFERRLPKK